MVLRHILGGTEWSPISIYHGIHMLKGNKKKKKKALPWYFFVSEILHGLTFI